MDCEAFQDRVLDAGRASELPQEAAEHAAGCERCAAFLADMQAIETALGPEAYAPVPRRVRRSLMQAFDEEFGAAEPRPWFSLPAVPKFALAGAAACAVALMVWVGRTPGGVEPEMEVTALSVTVLPGEAPEGFAPGIR